MLTKKKKTQLLKPRKDTVFPVSPFPGIPKAYRECGAAVGIAEVGDVGNPCVPRGFWEIALSGSAVRYWVLEVFWVLCSPGRQLTGLFTCLVLTFAPPWVGPLVHSLLGHQSLHCRSQHDSWWRERKLINHGACQPEIWVLPKGTNGGPLFWRRL